VTAEGIETPEQLAKLQELHCESGQGFLLSRPLSATAVTEMLTSERTTPRAA